MGGCCQPTRNSRADRPHIPQTNVPTERHASFGEGQVFLGASCRRVEAQRVIEHVLGDAQERGKANVLVNFGPMDRGPKLLDPVVRSLLWGSARQPLRPDKRNAQLAAISAVSRSRRPNDGDRPIGGRADVVPRRICSPPADVVAARALAEPQPDFEFRGPVRQGRHRRVRVAPDSGRRGPRRTRRSRSSRRPGCAAPAAPPRLRAGSARALP